MTEEAYEIDPLKKKGAAEGQEAGELEGKQLGEEPIGQRRARLARQVRSIILLTMAYVSLGATLTWPSPAISSLSEDNSTLVGTEIVLTSAEKDMTGSLLYLGMLFGAWAGGMTVGRLGRRFSLQLLTPSYLVGWAICGLAPTTAVLLIGRFILGVSGGGTTIAGYAYVVELPDISIRSSMAVVPTLGVVIGSLYSVAVGYYFPWHYLSFVGALPPTIFFFFSFFLPLSPSFLVVKGRRQQAITILQELRGKYVNVEEEVSELERRNMLGSTGYRGLLQRDVLKRVAVVVMLFVLMQMCGNFVFMIYTARILESTGAAMDPDAITVMVGALRVAGTVVAIFLLGILGRRLSLIISHAINASCLIILGTYIYLAENAAPVNTISKNLTWVPTVCVTLSLFFCDLGVHPVPYVLSSEYFPTSIRAQASSVCISAGTIITFVALQLYSPMQATLTQAGLYWFYGATSIFGVVFCFLAVTETKGKSLG